MQIKRTRLILLLLAGIITLTFVAAACSSSSPPPSRPTAQPTVLSAADKAAMEQKAMEAKAMEDKAMAEKAMMAKLPDQQFAAHFVDSNPKHAATLAQVPGAITLNFNFTLSDASTITVTRDGTQVTSGKPILSSNKLTMTTTVPSTGGNGTYIVDYKACWPDNSCHIGKFAFTVGS